MDLDIVMLIDKPNIDAFIHHFVSLAVEEEGFRSPYVG